MSNPFSMRGEENLVLQVAVPNRFASFAHAHMQVGHKIAEAIGVAPFEVKVRKQRTHQLFICVPLGDQALSIHRGSGVVGQILVETTPGDDYGLIELCFEGAVHGQKMTFDDKLFHAAGRLIERYPSVARMVVPLEEVEIVGYYLITEDYRHKRAVIVDEDFLKEWQAPLT